MRIGFMLTVSLLFFTFLPAVSADTSALWGIDGEVWDSYSRLPDFSYAGYHAGERDLPTATEIPN
ncbi:MAG: hypothetical protein KKC05_04160, partial [Nanoarchaeota archaeon]|nr:hypothetical protein [Nanoarchaeota archaeon]